MKISMRHYSVLVIPIFLSGWLASEMVHRAITLNVPIIFIGIAMLGVVFILSLLEWKIEEAKRE